MTLFSGARMILIRFRSVNDNSVNYQQFFPPASSPKAALRGTMRGFSGRRFAACEYPLTLRNLR